MWSSMMKYLFCAHFKMRQLNFIHKFDRRFDENESKKITIKKLVGECPDAKRLSFEIKTELVIAATFFGGWFI